MKKLESVQNSGVNHGTDGIGYTFFSYGNVSAIANSASYGYLTLNGIDGIFHKYGTTIDPGQPSIAGALPSSANLPATCAGGAGNFPCAEVQNLERQLVVPESSQRLLPGLVCFCAS